MRKTIEDYVLAIHTLKRKAQEKKYNVKNNDSLSDAAKAEKIAAINAALMEKLADIQPKAQNAFERYYASIIAKTPKVDVFSNDFQTATAIIQNVDKLTDAAQIQIAERFANNPETLKIIADMMGTKNLFAGTLRASELMQDYQLHDIAALNDGLYYACHRADLAEHDELTRQDIFRNRLDAFELSHKATADIDTSSSVDAAQAVNSANSAEF